MFETTIVAHLIVGSLGVAAVCISEYWTLRQNRAIDKKNL